MDQHEFLRIVNRKIRHLPTDKANDRIAAALGSLTSKQFVLSSQEGNVPEIHDLLVKTLWTRVKDYEVSTDNLDKALSYF